MSTDSPWTQGFFARPNWPQAAERTTAIGACYRPLPVRQVVPEMSFDARICLPRNSLALRVKERTAPVNLLTLLSNPRTVRA